jgi:imidazolonepropionase
MTTSAIAPSLAIVNARILTLSGPPGPRRGAGLRELGVIPRGGVRVSQVGLILEVGEGLVPRLGDDVIDAHGRVLMPGFVDCHTHACFAGSRLDEWERKLAGATYQEIMSSGGGIMSTVRATRETPRARLAELLHDRLDRFLQLGTTTVEVKSGYGLTQDAELAMLRAIRDASHAWEGTLLPTALLGHAIDPDAPDFVSSTIGASLDAVHAEFPGIAIDVYCEQGSWSLDASRELLTRARQLGHTLRAHADQFNAMGLTREAASLGLRSVDHLEASTDADLRALANSDTVGVGLPICGMHLDHRYARLRTLVDIGGIVAIATNFNPGSAPCMSMPLAIAAAVRHCGLTPAEAITAATLNAAHVLGLPDRGHITQGARADLILLTHEDERALAYELGGDPVDVVVVGGQAVKDAHGELDRWA